MNHDDYEQLPGLRASDLVKSLTSWKQMKYELDHGSVISPDTVRVGTCVHWLVETMPNGRFDERYRICPDYTRHPDNVTDTGRTSTSPTSWSRRQTKLFREQCEADGRIMLTAKEAARLRHIVIGVLGCREAMEIAINSQREVPAYATIEGVKCKSLTDGLHPECAWNLKTTDDISRFKWTMRDHHYLWMDSFRCLVMETTGITLPDEFAYIIADECKPTDDLKFKRPPDCCVRRVPMDVLRNYWPDIRARIKRYGKLSDQADWPGHESGPLEIPDYDMPETTLVD